MVLIWWLMVVLAVISGFRGLVWLVLLLLCAGFAAFGLVALCGCLVFLRFAILVVLRVF